MHSHDAAKDYVLNAHGKLLGTTEVHPSYVSFRTKYGSPFTGDWLGGFLGKTSDLLPQTTSRSGISRSSCQGVSMLDTSVATCDDWETCVVSYAGPSGVLTDRRGWCRGPFALVEFGAVAPFASIFYLVHRPSGLTLAAFAEGVEAGQATRIAARLADWSLLKLGGQIDDLTLRRLLAAWSAAGFYVLPTADFAGNPVWRRSSMLEALRGGRA